MNKILDSLFNQWEENSMNTKEVKTAFSVLCEGKDIAEHNERVDVLGMAISEESRVAFYAGFKTAVQLLIGGGLV